MRNKVMLFLIAFLGMCFVPNYAKADGETAQVAGTYSINIIKYKIEANASLPFSVPTDGTQADTSNASENLSTMSGIQYDIKRVVPKEGATDLTQTASYQDATGNDAFTMTVVTNKDGVATINGLTAGTYIVTEQADSQIKEVMAPVLVKLPMSVNGEVLDTVYIYPKSNVVNPETDKPKTPQEGKIPQTSGTIGTNHQILFMISLVIIMGIIGMTKFKGKKANQE